MSKQNSTDNAAPQFASEITLRENTQFLKTPEGPLKLDFDWTSSAEPHAIRRKQILEKYPQVQDLFGPEILTFPFSIALILLQLYMGLIWAPTASAIPLFLAIYMISGTINHCLQLCVHEITHNLCFDDPFLNTWLAIICNIPTGVPSAVTFKVYHNDHHQQQGVDEVDTDIPTLFEALLVKNSTWRKVLFVICQPIEYGLRPVFCRAKPITKWTVANAIVVLGFDVLVGVYGSVWSLVYFVGGSLIGMGLHPCAGHFIAEHYVLPHGRTASRSQETYSYYGSCNWFNLNVGYHVEHHDFPRVPWSRLPLLRKIAPEFYELPHYTSYIMMYWEFFTNPTVCCFSRVKRPKA